MQSRPALGASGRLSGRPPLHTQLRRQAHARPTALRGCLSGRALGPVPGDSCPNGRGALHSENGAVWLGWGRVTVSGRRLLLRGAFAPLLPFASRADALEGDRPEETRRPGRVCHHIKSSSEMCAVSDRARVHLRVEWTGKWTSG